MIRFDWRFPSLPSLPIPETKYKPNEKGEEHVGLKNAKMIWQTGLNVDNSVDDAGASGLRLNIFDTTTRADSAHIRLLNSSGSSKTIRGCVIWGKPILRYSGDQGYIHDALINYDDILENGEKKHEFGNNYICIENQLRQLADWKWKNLKSKRHVYQVSIVGRCLWYSPGEWVTLRILVGGELIDSVCECCDVQVEGAHGSLGQTVLILREIYANWTFNTNAFSRYVGQGGIKKMLSHNKIRIASSTYLRGADYYCDGVADQVEINNAITNLAGVGGGTVELTEGTFKTDGAIVPASNIAIVGQGWNTIIEKNANAYAIDIQGTSGTYKENIIVRDLKITRNAADTNNIALVHLKYARNVTLENLIIDDSYGDGIVVEYCENIKLVNCIISNAEVNGVILKQTLQAAILACLITACGENGVKAITDDVVDMIDRGDCESVTAPMVTGETIPFMDTDITYARDAAQKYSGSYSWKITKTVGGGIGAAYFTDNVATNDLHGLSPGKSYRFQTKIYFPSTNSGSVVQTHIVLLYFSGTSWKYAHAWAVNITNAWQLLEVCMSFPADATGATLFIRHSPMYLNDVIYIDEVKLFESDYENNGYIISNCTFKDNASHGIYIATNEAQVIDNRLIDNGAVSIYLAGGNRNKIAENVAVRSGDYSNLMNFFDGGTNTYIGV